MRKTSSRLKPFRDILSWNWLPIVGCLVVFGLLAVVLIRAAGTSTSFEPDTQDITGSVTRGSNSVASGGKFITFNGATATQTGCGLVGAVFCETFEEGPTAQRGRAGDFDPARISASRFYGNQYQDNQFANWVKPAQTPGCRNNTSATPFPPDDTLICDPNSVIQTHYGMTSAAAQNYGDNFYRIAQPMDIAGRTGIIDFDTSLYTIGGLFGWPEIAFTNQPITEPSIIAENSNGGVAKEGVLLHLEGACDNVRTYTNYAETLVRDLGGSNDNGCTNTLATKTNQLNHVQVRFSQTHLEIWASDYSNDGVTYGALKKLYAADINLTFSRGWVSFGVHNHATEKYSHVAGFDPGYDVPSWTVNWDNIAFDGPAINPARIYSAPDANVLVDGGMSLGYILPLSTDTAMTPITIKGVNPSGATSAQLTAITWSDAYNNPDFAGKKLLYRLNSKAWHTVSLSALEVSTYQARSAARFNYVIDIDPAELVSGDNTVQFANQGNNGGYKPLIANIDLLVNP